MFDNLFGRNCTSIWKKFTRLSQPIQTHGFISLNMDQPKEVIEQIENGTHVFILKNHGCFEIAYADKDGDYKTVHLNEFEHADIINSLKRIPNQSFYENGHEIDLPLNESMVDSINELLTDSKFKITTNTSAPTQNLFEYLAGGISYVAGCILTLPIAGIKTLIDWKSRSPISKEKSEMIAEHVRDMEPGSFSTLVENIRSKYQQSCTTSDSSRKMIKALNQLTRLPLRDYMSDQNNNGKKLFCTVVKEVESLTPYQPPKLMS